MQLKLQNWIKFDTVVFYFMLSTWCWLMPESHSVTNRNKRQQQASNLSLSQFDRLCRIKEAMLKHNHHAREGIFGRLTITRAYFTSTKRINACQRYHHGHAARVGGLSVSFVSVCRSSGTRA
uniref:Putative secreted protein n=1 Tax=Ixodes ricinus TaxID=34613 RepID=A0A6B0UN51_IXORI